MYVVIRASHGDALVNDMGTYAGSGTVDIDSSTSSDDSSSIAGHWYDGFDVTVYDLPWWVSVFYVTFQATLIAISIYALIRGL